MVMVVVPANSADKILDALVNAGFTATYAETHGGMLQQSQYSLFIAVNKENLEKILDIVQENCRTRINLRTKGEIGGHEKLPVTADLGGAVVFIWDINQIITY